MHGGLDAGLRADQQTAGQVDPALDGAFDRDQFRAGHRPFDGDVRPDERAVDLRHRVDARRKFRRGSVFG